MVEIALSDKANSFGLVTVASGISFEAFLIFIIFSLSIFLIFMDGKIFKFCMCISTGPVT